MKESDAVRSACASRAQPLLLPNNGMPGKGHPAPCRAVAFVGRGYRGATCTVRDVGFPSQCRAGGRAAAPRQAETGQPGPWWWIHFVSFNLFCPQIHVPIPAAGCCVRPDTSYYCCQACTWRASRAEQRRQQWRGARATMPCQLTDEWRSMDGFREGGSNWYISTRFQPFRGPATGF
jgi:hypothetical protein